MGQARQVREPSELCVQRHDGRVTVLGSTILSTREELSSRISKSRADGGGGVGRGEVEQDVTEFEKRVEKKSLLGLILSSPPLTERKHDRILHQDWDILILLLVWTREGNLAALSRGAVPLPVLELPATLVQGESCALRHLVYDLGLLPADPPLSARQASGVATYGVRVEHGQRAAHCPEEGGVDIGQIS
ncbi:hypothetical protein RRG08_044245 [Elysia crispata]|uniref:Uncharacterized protein n=1 Tax=Elysia crispata TaxID=231223 RepID=A0AAE0XWS6_9GAST|nr:hypothetical protein RRG08_044245 [Elysia crispata]